MKRLLCLESIVLENVEKYMHGIPRVIINILFLCVLVITVVLFSL